MDDFDSYKIYFDWTNVSNFCELELKGGSVHCVESRPKYAYAIGNHRLTAGEKYYWEIQLVNGVNFKLGVIKSGGAMKKDYDSKDVFTFSSRGVLHSANFEKGENTDIQFSAGDVVGVLFDGEKGVMSYSLNRKKIGTFFLSLALKTETFYPLACLMSEGEVLTVL
jgi:hypothetical protein